MMTGKRHPFLSYRIYLVLEKFRGDLVYLTRLDDICPLCCWLTRSRDTKSLTDSITDYPVTWGRRYHKYKEGGV
jgi:hypothetical protein